MSRPVSRTLACIVFASTLACGSGGGRAPAELTADTLQTYLRVAPVVRLERHAAKLAGESPTRWHEWPPLVKALEEVQWTMDDYLNVEARVSAARLALENPELFAKEFRPSDAPKDNVDLVRPHLERVKVVQGPLESLRP